MVGMMLVRKLKALLLLLVGVIKRCFCCFRKRRDSTHGLPIMVHGQDRANTYAGSSTSPAGESGGSWEDWDGPSSVVCEGGGGGGGRQLSPIEQQIHEYRLAQQRKLADQQLQQQEEEEPNLFQDLAPSLPRKPQVVIYARPDDDNGALSNRHSITCTDALMQVGGELREWDEEGGEEQWDSGGEGVDPEEVDLVLQQQKQQQRQQQRLAREARKQQTRLQREAAALSRESRGKIATKLS